MTVDWFGMALIFLGMTLMVAEALIPSFGLIGVSGVAAFVLGGVYLGGAGSEGFLVSLPTLIGFSIIGLLILAGILFIAFRVKKRHRVVTGQEQLIGQQARVVSIEGETIYADVNGELWKLFSNAELSVGDNVEITSVTGLTLHVVPHQASRRT